LMGNILIFREFGNLSERKQTNKKTYKNQTTYNHLFV